MFFPARKPHTWSLRRLFLREFEKRLYLEWDTEVREEREREYIYTSSLDRKSPPHADRSKEFWNFEGQKGTPHQEFLNRFISKSGRRGKPHSNLVHQFLKGEKGQRYTSFEHLFNLEKQARETIWVWEKEKKGIGEGKFRQIDICKSGVTCACFAYQNSQPPPSSGKKPWPKKETRNRTQV